jgi:hypothetical protein
MSASSYRTQLDRKVRARADAEKKVGEFRQKEADKRTKAAKERAAAAKTSSPTTAKSKLRAAERYEDEAVPRQVADMILRSGKLGIRGLAAPVWTSWGRFQARASWGRTALYSRR